MKKLTPEMMSTQLPLPFHTQETLRFGDQDVQGHINNAVYSTLLECSRVAFQSDPERFNLAAGQIVVIAALSVEFLRELHWPATVDIRLGVTRIGRSSFGFRQEIWLQDTLIAKARSTQVMIDAIARTSVALSDDQRQQLQAWVVDGEIQ
ncbi:thioesterase family protein [Gymnodinialimonas sp. 57CJ19]|uniref:acyl-CoA thioesterase n=1 Tax=Gymnodinialimonas sp. 57CJ19 TaxID=3138498 RepID=UPI003134280C